LKEKYPYIKNKYISAISPRLVGFILLAELFLNASLYFALKSGHDLLTALLFGLIVLGYLGLVLLK
jgi:hypothetical protein